MGPGDSDGALIDAAVDLDVVAEAVTVAIVPRSPDLRHGLLFHKSLTPESGHDGHDEEQIDLIEKGNDCFERRRRIQRQPATEPRVAGSGEGVAHVVISLDVDGDAVGPGSDESIEILVGPRHHEVHIERDRRVGTNCRNELGTEGDIFHKMSVHDIEVEPVRPGLFSLFDLLADSRPVGRENGRGNDSGVAVAHAGAIIFTVSVFRKPLSPETYLMVSHFPGENEDSPIDLTSDTFMMSQALRQAQKAYLAEEVPIGAIIVREGRIIARAHNQVETLRDATAHAEMLALTQAQEVQGDWRLTDCDLYVTKEPCPMCAGAIVHCRIRRVIFGCGDPKGGAAGGLLNLLQQPTLNHHSEITPGVLEEESIQLLKAFFHEARLKKKAGPGG